MDTMHLRRMADRQIRRLGGRVGAIMREEGASGDAPDAIPIMFTAVQYSTREIGSGDLISPIDRKLVISTFRPDGTDLGVIPDPETDTIVSYFVGTEVVEKTYLLKARPTLYDPHGIVTLIEQQGRERDT
jgi:hypothetical protein